MDHLAQIEYGTDGIPIGETPEARAARIKREAEMIAQGERDFAEGRFVDWSVAQAWLESLDNDPDAPLPLPTR